MFFYIARTIGFLLHPLPWIVLALLLAVFIKHRKWRKNLFLGALICLILFSNPMLFKISYRAWSTPQRPHSSLPVYDYGIVLGGMVHYDSRVDRVVYNQGIDRLLQAVKLYRRGLIKKIVISGGHGGITPDLAEAIVIKDLLMEFNIPENDIIIEAKSRNTHENAIYTAKMLAPQKKKASYLLITSGHHLPRARACFKKAGLPTDCYATDPMGVNTSLYILHLVPSVEVMRHWHLLLHEMFGYLTYAIMGYL